MEIDRGDICRYLDFLRDEPGYCITLHGEPAEWPEFVRYNFHPNPYCHYVKTVCECWSECIARQRKVTAACRDVAFFGICYAGVGEYVYPLTADGVQIGFLSVSGYLWGTTNRRHAKRLRILRGGTMRLRRRLAGCGRSICGLCRRRRRWTP